MPVNSPAIKNAIPDVTIIGAGIVGLWCGLLAVKAGLRPLIIDSVGVGAGASGGVIGALMPHQPSMWSPKKQLQLQGLISLPNEIAELESQTGQSAHYARVGRILPIWTELERRKHEAWEIGAQTHWPSHFSWTLNQAFKETTWIDPLSAPLGFAFDSLAARLNPRAICLLLAKAIENKADFLFGVGVDVIESDRSILLNDANRISTSNVLVTTGIKSFELLEPIVGRKTGTGVKGQSALLRPKSSFDASKLPVIFADGLYIIAHDNGLIAVGSTSENEWQSANTTDNQLDGLLQRAETICPLLRGADVIERWAGIRPKHESRDPVVAEVTQNSGIIVATGGFKISFAIAHLMAREAIGYLTGSPGEFREMLAGNWHRKPK